MARGIERCKIFLDALDYENFLVRLDRLILELGFCCFGWVLMPNHLHLVLQTGAVPLARLMARLETGYARYFNNRYQRSGHLLQNRYRSRLVKDETDLLGLVLYVHRNPVRAGLVDSVRALGHLPWCGHGALTGERPPRPFESVGSTLRLLADDPAEARRRLVCLMQAPLPPQSGVFVEGALPAALPSPRSSSSRSSPAADSVQELIRRVCEAHGVSAEALGPRHRSRRVVAARTEVAQRAICGLGMTSRDVARALGVSDAAVSRALARDDVRARFDGRGEQADRGRWPGH